MAKGRKKRLVIKGAAVGFQKSRARGRSKHGTEYSPKFASLGGGRKRGRRKY